jgi:protein-disulfide isomerase
VRVVYKNYVVHPEVVMQAHRAACAAHLQGKFMAFDKLFWDQGFNAYAQSRDPGKLSGDNLMKIAKEAGLDTKKLEADMNGEACTSRIQADMAELSKFGINATPSFFVNGKFTMFEGPGEFKAIIDEALKDVAASGVPADQYYQQVVMGQGLKQFRSKKDAKGAAPKPTR